jgi:hypothetical protein
MLCRLFCLLVAGLGFCLPQLALSAPPRMLAHGFSEAPVLDGEVINDPAWRATIPATGFRAVRPVEGALASQRTEVSVGFTDTAMYIGVVCYDENPAGIVITDSRRDSSMDDTDSFQVVLDSFADRQNGFVFGTTPTAVEYDGQVTNQGSGSFGSGGGGFNLNWDTIWSVKTKVGDFGWSAEMEIPFKSLRYSAEEVQNWGINFQRNIRRNQEIVYWAPIGREYNLFRVSEAGMLEGLQLPSQRNLKFTPYVLAEAERGGTIDGTDYNEEFGFDAKYSITPSLTLDVTYNTDFAQVEVDEIQVNLDRFSLFFPEKRPFFLENAGQFAVGTPREVELFFSRRIGVGPGGVQTPIDGGVRLSGKVGPSTNVGLLYMSAEEVGAVAPQNDFTVARINQELPNRSLIGAIFVERDGDGSISGDDDSDYNRAYAVDGQWGIGDGGTVSGYVAKSETPGRRDNDMAYRLQGRYDSATLTAQGGYTKVEENFNPEVGFLRRRNYEKVEVFTLYRHRPRDFMGLYEIRPHIASNAYFDDEGYWESGFTHVDSHWEWHNGIEIHTGVDFFHEGVKEPFEINPGTFVLPGEYDEARTNFVFQTDEGKPLSFKTTLKRGGFFGGDINNIETSVTARYGERFSSALTWNYNDIDLPVENGEFEVNVGRLRLSYSFTPKILLQALVQYDDRADLVGTNLRFSWLQSASAGLYLVYNEIDDETVRGPIKKRREFVIKYSRIIDLL